MVPTEEEERQLPVEGDVFLHSKKMCDTPEGIPYRRLHKVSIFDYKFKPVSLLDIERNGPFQAIGVAPSNKYVNVKYWECRILLPRVDEFSFEFPYGKEAIIWLRTPKAFYQITSVSDDYLSWWKPIIEKATISGHVINTILNLRPRCQNNTVLEKIINLAKQPASQVLDLIVVHREFILQEIRKQRDFRLMAFPLVKSMESSDHITKLLFKLRENLITEMALIPQNTSLGTSNSPNSFKERTDFVTEDASSSTIDDIYDKDDNNDDIISIGIEYFESPHLPIKRPLNQSKELPVGIVDVMGEEESPSEKQSLPLIASILPSQIIALPMPGHEDEVFECPFCKLLFHRRPADSVVAQLARHVKSVHMSFGLDTLSTATKPPSALPFVSEALSDWWGDSKAIIGNYVAHGDLMPRQWQSSPLELAEIPKPAKKSAPLSILLNEEISEKQSLSIEAPIKRHIESSKLKIETVEIIPSDTKDTETLLEKSVSEDSSCIKDKMPIQRPLTVTTVSTIVDLALINGPKA